MDHNQPLAAAPRQGAPDAEEVWREPAAGLLARLNTTAAGLSAESARQRLGQYGLNTAATEKRRPLALQFLARFRNPLIVILLIASGMSAATGDVASFIVIAVIVLLSISLDFVQEVRAQTAVEALRRSVAVQATVRRDGHAIRVRSAPSVRPWPAKRTDGHRRPRPVLHNWHDPHGLAGSAATRSPAREPPTTMPPNS